MNKFDFILIGMLALFVWVLWMNEYNITHDYDQLSQWCWVAVGGVCGVETITFCLKKVKQYKYTNTNEKEENDDGETKEP